MSTNVPVPRSSRHWVVPALGLPIGLVALVTESVRGHSGRGVVFLLIMAAYSALVVLFARRSERVSLLRTEEVDARAGSISPRAAALTGYVLSTVLVAGLLVQLARGADLRAWWGLCAVGGLTFGASLAVPHRRS